MALLEPQKLSVCKILGINKIRLDKQLIAMGPNITDEAEAEVLNEIDRWESGIGDDFTRIEGNVKNFGLNDDPEAAKDDVRKNIMNLLFFEPDDIGSGSVSES